MFKMIEGAADCEIQSVIRFLNTRNVLPSEIITRSIKCMVTMRWVMAWLGNEFRCSTKDERTCTIRHEVGIHLWWMMIWCVRSTKECVTTDVSQFLICPCTFLRFRGLYDTVSSSWHRRRPHSMRRVYKNLCPSTVSASIMAANVWKNSLKNAESENNKILYETLLDFFYGETVLTFWISPVNIPTWT